MRNQPNDQRSIQNTISKSLQIKVELIGVIHGTMRPDSDPATLMVLQTRCIFPKIPVRVTGSEIQITFDAASSSDPAPTVAGLSPDPPYVFGLDASGIDTPDGNEQQEGKITATSRVSEPAFHRRNTAIWTIEGSSTGNGVPSTMQVAVLLRRESCREFRARFKIRFKVGSLRETMTLAKSAAESPGTTVLFDPRKPSFGSLDVDPKNLASYDLNQWLRFELPVLKPPAVQKGYYVELWNFQVSGSVILPTPSPGLSKEVPGFQDLPCIRWSRELDDLLFEDFFPWATKEPRRERDTTVHADGPPNFQGEERRICSVLLSKANQGILKHSPIHDGLFGEPVLQTIGEYFDLPPQYHDALHQEGGSCQRVECGDKYYGYIVQSPFYKRGIWSLILICDRSFKMGAAMIRSDTVPEISDVLHAAQTDGKDASHPLLLLFHLFLSHHRTTSEMLLKILEKVETVDSEIMGELQSEKANERPSSAGSHSQGRKKICDFGQLSQMLHEARMELVELAKRNTFESQLRGLLQKELKDESHLIWRMNMYTELSKRHGQYIQSLPERISSQTTVIYSLIARRDARLQYKLAKETVKDSKAMKTLAIITIFFLPGTFVATLFATNMISFTKGQEGWIYAVVVVPLTVIIMVSWILWIRKKKNPYRESDEEQDLESVNDPMLITKKVFKWD